MSGTKRPRPASSSLSSSDFKRRKAKVGKRATRPANVTDTSFRSATVRVGGQNVDVTVDVRSKSRTSGGRRDEDDDDAAAAAATDADATGAKDDESASSLHLTSSRGRLLDSLLSSLSHHAPNVRVSALRGILDAVMRARTSASVRSNLHVLLPSVGRCWSDEESRPCRTLAVSIAKACLRAASLASADCVSGMTHPPAVPARHMLPLLGAYASLALNSLDEHVRVDGASAVHALCSSFGRGMAEVAASSSSPLARVTAVGGGGGVNTAVVSVGSSLLPAYVRLLSDEARASARVQAKFESGVAGTMGAGGAAAGAAGASRGNRHGRHEGKKRRSASTRGGAVSLDVERGAGPVLRSLVSLLRSSATTNTDHDGTVCRRFGYLSLSSTNTTTAASLASHPSLLAYPDIALAPWTTMATLAAPCPRNAILLLRGITRGGGGNNGASTAIAAHKRSAHQLPVQVSIDLLDKLRDRIVESSQRGRLCRTTNSGPTLAEVVGPRGKQGSSNGGCGATGLSLSVTNLEALRLLVDACRVLWTDRCVPYLNALASVNTTNDEKNANLDTNGSEPARSCDVVRASQKVESEILPLVKSGSSLLRILLEIFPLSDIDDIGGDDDDDKGIDSDGDVDIDDNVTYEDDDNDNSNNGVFNAKIGHSQNNNSNSNSNRSDGCSNRGRMKGKAYAYEAANADLCLALIELGSALSLSCLKSSSSLALVAAQEKKMKGRSHGGGGGGKARGSGSGSGSGREAAWVDAVLTYVLPKLGVEAAASVDDDDDEDDDSDDDNNPSRTRNRTTSIFGTGRVVFAASTAAAPLLSAVSRLLLLIPPEAGVGNIGSGGGDDNRRHGLYYHLRDANMRMHLLVAFGAAFFAPASDDCDSDDDGEKGGGESKISRKVRRSLAGRKAALLLSELLIQHCPEGGPGRGRRREERTPYRLTRRHCNARSYRVSAWIRVASMAKSLPLYLSSWDSDYPSETAIVSAALLAIVRTRGVGRAVEGMDGEMVEVFDDDDNDDMRGRRGLTGEEEEEGKEREEKEEGGRGGGGGVDVGPTRGGRRGDAEEGEADNDDAVAAAAARDELVRSLRSSLVPLFVVLKRRDGDDIDASASNNRAKGKKRTNIKTTEKTTTTKKKKQKEKKEGGSAGDESSSMSHRTESIFERLHLREQRLLIALVGMAQFPSPQILDGLSGICSRAAGGGAGVEGVRFSAAGGGGGGGGAGARARASDDVADHIVEVAHDLRRTVSMRTYLSFVVRCAGVSQSIAAARGRAKARARARAKVEARLKGDNDHDRSPGRCGDWEMAVDGDGDDDDKDSAVVVLDRDGALRIIEGDAAVARACRSLVWCKAAPGKLMSMLRPVLSSWLGAGVGVGERDLIGAALGARAALAVIASLALSSTEAPSMSSSSSSLAGDAECSSVSADSGMSPDLEGLVVEAICDHFALAHRVSLHQSVSFRGGPVGDGDAAAALAWRTRFLAPVVALLGCQPQILERVVERATAKITNKPGEDPPGMADGTKGKAFLSNESTCNKRMSGSATESTIRSLLYLIRCESLSSSLRAQRSSRAVRRGAMEIERYLSGGPLDRLGGELATEVCTKIGMGSQEDQPI